MLIIQFISEIPCWMPCYQWTFFRSAAAATFVRCTGNVTPGPGAVPRCRVTVLHRHTVFWGEAMVCTTVLNRSGYGCFERTMMRMRHSPAYALVSCLWRVVGSHKFDVHQNPVPRATRCPFRPTQCVCLFSDSMAQSRDGRGSAGFRAALIVHFSSSDSSMICMLSATRILQARTGRGGMSGWLPRV